MTTPSEDNPQKSSDIVAVQSASDAKLVSSDGTVVVLGPINAESVTKSGHKRRRRAARREEEEEEEEEDEEEEQEEDESSSSGTSESEGGGGGGGGDKRIRITASNVYQNKPTKRGTVNNNESRTSSNSKSSLSTRSLRISIPNNDGVGGGVGGGGRRGRRRRGGRGRGSTSASSSSTNKRSSRRQRGAHKRHRGSGSDGFSGVRSPRTPSRGGSGNSVSSLVGVRPVSFKGDAWTQKQEIGTPRWRLVPGGGAAWSDVATKAQEEVNARGAAMPPTPSAEAAVAVTKLGPAPIIAKWGDGGNSSSNSSSGGGGNEAGGDTHGDKAKDSNVPANGGPGNGASMDEGDDSNDDSVGDDEPATESLYLKHHVRNFLLDQEMKESLWRVDQLKKHKSHPRTPRTPHSVKSPHPAVSPLFGAMGSPAIPSKAGSYFPPGSPLPKTGLNSQEQYVRPMYVPPQPDAPIPDNFDPPLLFNYDWKEREKAQSSPGWTRPESRIVLLSDHVSNVLDGDATESKMKAIETWKAKQRKPETLSSEPTKANKKKLDSSVSATEERQQEIWNLQAHHHVCMLKLRYLQLIRRHRQLQASNS